MGKQLAGLFFGGIALASGVCAQDYPSAPIRIFTGTAGGGLDFAARLLSPRLATALGQSVIIENRGFVISPETVARSKPDGHTLLFFGSPFWLAPFLRQVPFDPIRDFAPITLAVTSPDILVVHPSVPARNVKELIALARARPGELNYASSAIGAGSHLAAELFKSMARVDIVHIPYKGVTVALTSMLGGQVQVMFATAGAVAPHLKSGRLRGLAVGSQERSPLVPDLPTVAAAGLPGFQSVGIFGIFAPAGTPPTALSRLNQEIVRVLGQPEVREHLLKSGVEAVGNTPEQLAAAVKREMTTLGKLIKDVGITAD